MNLNKTVLLDWRKSSVFDHKITKCVQAQLETMFSFELVFIAKY